MNVAEKAEWTVFTFIAAHNNLQAFGEQSLRQISDVGSTQKVVLGAFLDTGPGAGLYVMGIDTPGLAESQQLLGDYDSGEPAGVVAAALWLFEKYPANRYGLVLWSHGTGWEPAEIEEVARQARLTAPADGGEGRRRAMLEPESEARRAILFDDGSGHSLDTLELAGAISQISQQIKQPLDLLGMDACLMANLEVACQLHGSAKYLVASEELVPAHSWPYLEIYRALRDTPEMLAADFARLIVREYVKFYTDHPPGGGDVTAVALDVERVDELTTAADQLAGALIDNIGTDAETLAQAQIDTRATETRKDTRKPSKFDFHLWDLGSLARRLAAGGVPAVRACATSLLERMKNGNGAVLAEGHVGTWFDGIGGLTIYLPQPPGGASEHYAPLRFATETRWPALMGAYRNAFPPG
jgi:hypothetical protein